jgi:pilus assembly protein Flp/PilA
MKRRTSWWAKCFSQCEEIKMRDITLSLYVRLQNLRSSLRNLAADGRGQDLIEYALVVALIAFAAAAGMTTVATKINAAFTNIGTKLTTYTS